MLQNACVLAKFDADTAENETNLLNFANMLTIFWQICFAITKRRWAAEQPIGPSLKKACFACKQKQL